MKGSTRTRGMLQYLPRIRYKITTSDSIEKRLRWYGSLPTGEGDDGAGILALDRLRAAILGLLSRMNRVEEIVLFGSLANGTYDQWSERMVALNRHQR